MQYLKRSTLAATVLLASCLQAPSLRAGTTSVELMGELQPLAVWRLDDEPRRVIVDETEKFLGRSQGGATFAGRGAIPSESNGAMEFDGASGCIVVPHREAFVVDQGTIACWFRADDVQRTQGILSKDASGFGDGGHVTVSIGQRKLTVRLQSTTESYEIRSPVRKGQWTHIAFTFGSEGMQLFVDGKLSNSNAYEGGLGESSGGVGNHEPVVFAASTMTSAAASELPLANYFKGELDEISIFTRQLSPVEIVKLVDIAKPQYTSLVRAYVANHPMAWWRLDEAEGESLAIDQVGQQHGNYNVVGSSYFDGDDFVDIGALDLDESFTILAQIKPSNFAVANARIVAKENGLGEEDQFWSLSTKIRDDQTRLRFRLRTKDGTREAVASDRGINVNQLMCIAAVYDGRRMRLYQDGELVSEVAHRGHPMTNAHCHVWIGDSPSGAGKRPFNGMIKDVAILKHAISSDQIKAIVQASCEPMKPSAEVVESLPPPPVKVDPGPFVHRCPLCDLRYREIPIYRVSLPGMYSLPVCDTPTAPTIH
ncbi:MAG: LamG domain-containing protein [Planctomycetes bacterium]|nr:LamG domain-containing protein [Planctomycetota bacterium]